MPVSSDAISSPGAADGSTAEPPGAEISAPQLRKMQISEFNAWLRTQTNKHQRPFREETIRDYVETARVLDLWMSRDEIEEEMVDLYAADMQDQRAFNAKRRRGEMY
jgi:hypothetical protein